MTHSEVWLIITQNTTHSKFTRRQLCYLRTRFLEEIFNGDLPLGFACLAEFNYFSTSLHWEWMTLSRYCTYINTKFSDTNICSMRKQTLFEVPRYANAAPIRGVDLNRRITNFYPTAPIRWVPLYSKKWMNCISIVVWNGKIFVQSVLMELQQCWDAVQHSKPELRHKFQMSWHYIARYIDMLLLQKPPSSTFWCNVRSY